MGLFYTFGMIGFMIIYAILTYLLMRKLERIYKERVVARVDQILKVLNEHIAKQTTTIIDVNEELNIIREEIDKHE